MNKKIIVANWKMNPRSLTLAKTILDPIKKTFQRANFKGKKTIVICPPNSFLGIFDKPIKNISLGAQDLSIYSSGALTGEVGGSMLKSVGVNYVIIGHSERRAMGETPEIISKKILRALENKITPIICMGENKRDTEGQFFIELRSIIESTLAKVSKTTASKIILAYEPLWAISTEGNGAITPELLRETSIFIRRTLSELYGNKIGTKISILYGGSVNTKNAKEIVSLGEVDGLLIGKESLNSKDFIQIVSSI
ncbi:MAG: triose-phosphate isomerase [Candidatus Paceibacterota bacterium]